MDEKTRLPKVLIPFSRAENVSGAGDVVLYLRPETNGMLAESILFRTLRDHPAYGKAITLVYLANIPGEYIVSQGILEDHYKHKLEFAYHGGRSFTSSMIRNFEEWFGETFSPSRVFGAFAYCKTTGMDEEELFNFRVEEKDFLVLHGQTVKRLGDLYVVNYDLPAILHKNNQATDQAVFVLRSLTEYADFIPVIRLMETSLANSGILGTKMPPSRAFHYSKGPFEQILDSLGFLYNPDASHVSLEDLAFFQFLLSRGMRPENIEPLIHNPFVVYRASDGKEEEGDLFTLTRGMDYEEVLSFLSSSLLEVKKIF